MMMKKTLLKDIVKEFSPISDGATFKIEIYPTINEEKSTQPVEICNYTDFMTRCRYVHGFKSFLHFEDDNAKTEFTSLWYLFKTNYSNLRSWEMKYNAYFSEYNPIDNYDKQSKIETEYEGEEQNSYIGGETNELVKSGSEILTKDGEEYTEKTGVESVKFKGTETDALTKSGSEKVETEKTGTETHTRTGDEERYNVPFENNLYAPESKTKYNNVEDTDTFTNRKDTQTTSFPATRTDSNVKSFSNREDETSFNNRKDKVGFVERTDTTTFEERTDTATKTFSDDRVDVKSFVGRKDTVTERTHGNIGTTKASDIINSEWELRKLDLCYSIIDSFVNQYCTLLYTDV